MTRIDKTKSCPSNGRIYQVRARTVDPDKIFQEGDSIAGDNPTINPSGLDNRIADTGVVGIGDDVVITQQAQLIVA